MSIKDELDLRIKEDFRDCLPFQIEPVFTATNPVNSEKQEIKPFKIQLMINFNNNYQLFALSAINLGDEIYLLPQAIVSILNDLKQGKMGTGNFLIEGENFSTKTLVYTHQIHLYTDKINFDRDRAKKAFKSIGLTLIIKEYGANYKLEKRMALIFGNSDYQYTTKLNNAVHDAVSMDSVLKTLGFQTKLNTELSQREMKMAIDEFSDQMEDSDVGLFYYAGHGVEYNGINYLIPIDAKIKKANQIDLDCIRVDRVLAMMDNKRTKCNILILDACRDNPFHGINRKINAGGFVPMNAPYGSFIAFATSPNNIASDGEGENGLYTGSILKHLVTPNLKIEDVFKRVRADVEKQSKGEQITWDASSLVGDFYFKR